MVSSPAHGWLRLLRAAVVAVSALGLAAAAHRMGGGTLPGVAGVGWLGLGTFLVCWAGTSRRLGPGAIAGLLAALQLGLHVGMMAMAPPMASSMPMSAHATGGGSGPGFLGIGWVMVLAHVVATVLTALVLARGEQAAWFLARLVHHFVPALAPDRPVAHDAPAPAEYVVRPHRGRYASGGLGRRGPPLATS